MKRIVHVITGLNAGGAEAMLYKLLQHTDRPVIAPTVISLLDKGVIGAKIEQLGIEVRELHMARSAPPSPRVIIRLVRILNELKPDIVQGWMYHGNLAVLLAGRIKPKPRVFWNIRGSHVYLRHEKPLTAIIIKLLAMLSNYPDVIINNSLKSKELHENVLRYPAGRQIVIPNGFDTGRYKPDLDARTKVRHEWGIGENSIVVGAAGRYDPIKDYSNFLQAASIVARSDADVHFVMAGAGLDMANSGLVGLVAARGLHDRVHLLGYREDLHYLYSGLDIAVSSSLNEGFPNVIGEAMSCGVPCVVTDVGDSARIVGDTGRVVPSRDSAALAGGIRDLIAAGKVTREGLGARARKRIEEMFSIQSVVKRYEEEYLK